MCSQKAGRAAQAQAFKPGGHRTKSRNLEKEEPEEELEKKLCLHAYLDINGYHNHVLDQHAFTCRPTRPYHFRQKS